MKSRIFLHTFLTLSTIVFLSSCSDDPKVIPVPQTADAAFNFTYDAQNPNTVLFTASPSVETWYTHWSFGDGSSAEGLTATKTYFIKGEYDVRFRIFTEGGSADYLQTISIAEDIVDESNLVQNSEFTNNEFWTTFVINPGMDISFQDGKAVWAGGGGGHAGIYQEIEVEANVAYQINMDVAGSGATDSWFEVYFGTQQPVAGSDYTDGGMLLGLNTWNGCGNSQFSSKFVNISCNGGNGSTQFSSTGTAYLVIRGGGADYGADGISVDNVEVRVVE